MALAQLADWANFYVVTGSAAAGLTGLTFVVIALASEARRVEPVGLNTFVTPTIVHFGVVLALAAFMCVPHQTPLSLGCGLAAAGLGGLAYTGKITANVHHNLGQYVAVWEDWLWNVALPLLAYGGLCAAAVLVWHHLDAALDSTGAASVMLLFIGIHNAWDIAVWMSLRKHGESAADASKAADAAERSRAAERKPPDVSAETSRPTAVDDRGSS
jgi:hypothetical protein